MYCSRWDSSVMTISVWEFCWMVLAASVGVGDAGTHTWLAHMLQTWRVKTDEIPDEMWGWGHSPHNMKCPDFERMFSRLVNDEKNNLRLHCKSRRQIPWHPQRYTKGQRNSAGSPGPVKQSLVHFQCTCPVELLWFSS